MKHILKHTSRGAVAIAYGLLLFSFALQTTGCSLVGVGVGAISDSQKPSWAKVTRAQWTHLKPGEEVIVTRADSVRSEIFGLVGVIDDSTDSSGHSTPEAPVRGEWAMLLNPNVMRNYGTGGLIDQRVAAGDTLRLQAEAISSIYRQPHRHGVLHGFLIGLGIDATIIIALVATAGGRSGPAGF